MSTLYWGPERPVIWDLFCAQGGAGMGYCNAGFEVFGVDLDNRHRKHYPFPSVMGDAVSLLMDLAEGQRLPAWLPRPDAIHASPPCQAFSVTKAIHANKDHGTAWILDATRTALRRLDIPWVIENVPGAPMHDPITLCGTMFDLRVYRHRLFESNEELTAPAHHPKHMAKATQVGRQPKPGEFMTVAGHFANVAEAREAMGIDWMTREGLSQAIPPAYTEYIGKQLMAAIGERKAA